MKTVGEYVEKSEAMLDASDSGVKGHEQRIRMIMRAQVYAILALAAST